MWNIVQCPSLIGSHGEKSHGNEKLKGLSWGYFRRFQEVWFSPVCPEICRCLTDLDKQVLNVLLKD